MGGGLEAFALASALSVIRGGRFGHEIAFDVSFAALLSRRDRAELLLCSFDGMWGA
jgi:hypothetical protein